MPNPRRFLLKEASKIRTYLQLIDSKNLLDEGETTVTGGINNTAWLCKSLVQTIELSTSRAVYHHGRGTDWEKPRIVVTCWNLTLFYVHGQPTTLIFTCLKVIRRRSSVSMSNVPQTLWTWLQHPRFDSSERVILLRGCSQHIYNPTETVRIDCGWRSCHTLGKHKEA